MLLAAVAVLALLGALLIGRSYHRGTELLSGPFASLPEPAAAAVGYTSSPSLEQSVQIVKAVTGMGATPKVASAALASLLPAAAAGSANWAPQGQPWAGPRTALAWMPGPTPSPVAAVDVSDGAAAKAWAGAVLDPAGVAWDVVDGGKVLRISPSGPAALSYPTIGQVRPKVLDRVPADAVAVGWADLGRLSAPEFSAAAQTARLFPAGLLGSGSSGQVGLGVKLDGDLLVAEGLADHVVVQGAALDGPPADLASALGRVPASAAWAAAVSDPARVAQNYAVSLQAGSASETLRTRLADSGADVGLVARSDTGQTGIAVAGGDPGPAVAAAAAALSSTAGGAWAQPVSGPGVAATAASQQWAEALALPSAGRTLGSQGMVAELAPGAGNASAAAIVNIPASATGAESAFTAAGVVAGPGKDGVVPLSVRATFAR